jgi:hypothetical protein
MAFMGDEFPKARFISHRCILEEQRQQRIGRNFQEVIPTQFLAKLGAGRAQLGVFGRSGAIEAIYFHSEHCKALILTL